MGCALKFPKIRIINYLITRGINRFYLCYGSVYAEISKTGNPKKVNDMKLNHLISGILVAAVMLMCGASFAGTFTNDGILAAAPTDTVMVYEVDPPLVPAVKPNSDGIDSGSSRRLSIANFYQLNVDNMKPITVLACGYQSESIEIPTKVPIAV